MIFVTVGTHYMPFNRLIKMVEYLGVDEEVIIQSGSTSINLNSAVVKKNFKFDEMKKMISLARCVITHAGPATIFQVLAFSSNLPIVVPRRKRYGEHVSDHQYSFSKYLQERGEIILIDNAQQLKKAIKKPIPNDKNNSSNDAITMVTNISNWIESLNIR